MKRFLFSLLFAVLYLLTPQLHGQTLEWYHHFKGNDNDAIGGIAVDDSGFAYVCGHWADTSMTNPLQGVLQPTPGGTNFLAKFDTSGTPIWAKAIGVLPKEMELNPSGDLLLVGTFSGSVDFDPDSGTTILTSAGMYSDIFFATYDPNGGLVWAKKIAADSMGLVFVTGLVIGDSADIYMAGWFSGRIDFDPSVGQLSDSALLFEGFVVKYDGAGNYLWAQEIGGDFADQAREVDLDADGNVYVTGFFRDSVDFDPGAGLAFGVSNDNQFGDAFLTSFTSNGQFRWARNFGGANQDVGLTLKVDPDQRVWLGGFNRDTADLYPGPDSLVFGSGTFISRLDTSGTFIDAQVFGFPVSEDRLRMEIDPWGGIYLVGLFDLPGFDFDPGPDTFYLNPPPTGHESFIAKYNSQGHFLTATRTGGTDNRPSKIRIFSDGDVLFGAMFDTLVDADPGPGVIPLIPSGLDDALLARTTPICVAPEPVSLQTMQVDLCLGISDSVLLVVPGTVRLNDATAWHWYSDSCGGTPVGIGDSIWVAPTTDTTYYVRGEGGCTVPGSCSQVAVTVYRDTISTVAGIGGSQGFMGDSGLATNAWMNEPHDVVIDQEGNLFISEINGHRIRRVDAANQIITTVAGTGTIGYNGSGIPANTAQLSFPAGLCFNTDGDLMIADWGNNRIRRIDTTSWTIYDFAGTGVQGFSGDGGPAANCQLSRPVALTTDSVGDIWVADMFNGRVRKIDSAGIIQTMAGGGVSLGDGGPATSALINRPSDVKFDPQGNVWISSLLDHRVRKMGTNGIIATAVGNGTAGSSGDGGAAHLAQVDEPIGLAIDSLGNVLIADRITQRVRKINAFDNTISTLAGTGTQGFSGDGGDPVQAQFSGLGRLNFDEEENLYLADRYNQTIRRINSTPCVDAPACVNGNSLPPTVPNPTTSKSIVCPGDSALLRIGAIAILNGASQWQWYAGFCGGVVVGSGDSIWVSPTATTTYYVRGEGGCILPGSCASITILSHCDTITTIAGTGTHGYGGAGGPARLGLFNAPRDLALGANGDLYIADQANQRIRKVDGTTGIISTVVGTGVAGFNGDSIPAIAAQIDNPYSVDIAPNGDIYFPDRGNHRIRRVDAATGLIHTIAGTGIVGFSGDGGPATQAELNLPFAIELDAAGNVYFTSLDNNRVRKVDTNGIITTVAGGGSSLGDGGLATQAQLIWPGGVMVDSVGNIWISDYAQHRVRKVDTAGIINTVVGNGSAGFSGNGGPASSAQINRPHGMTFDKDGNLLLADLNNRRIRKVDLNSGIISTFAGTGASGYAGDGGPPAQALFGQPRTITKDDRDNCYIVDATNAAIRMIVHDPTTPILNQQCPALAAPNPSATQPEVCTGDSSLLFVSAGDSLKGASDWHWYSDSCGGTLVGTGDSIWVSPIASTTYYVRGEGGCLLSGGACGSVDIEVACDTITTLAGGNGNGFSGDGGPAASARLFYPQDVAVDLQGNVYIADAYNHRIRKIDNLTGDITTIAGTGVAGFNGDGMAALSTQLNYPFGLTVAPDGNLTIADLFNRRVRHLNFSTGVISTIAGTGVQGTTGDGGAATSAQLEDPYAVSYDPDGNLLITDRVANRIRRVDTAGIITTIAGGGIPLGDGGPATLANLNQPREAIADSSGVIWIADFGHGRIRRIDTNGIITTAAGVGAIGSLAEGVLANQAQLINLGGLAFDADHNLVFSERSPQGRIRKLDFSTNRIHTVAGTGTAGYTGDGGNALLAQVNIPGNLSSDSEGNLYIADVFNHAVRNIGGTLPPCIAPTVPVPTVDQPILCAGDTAWLSVASTDSLNSATGWHWYADSCGANLLGVGDSLAVTPTANTSYFVRGEGGCIIPGSCGSVSVTVFCDTITTIAGNGSNGFSGDGGLARLAQLSSPRGVVVDQWGNAFIADQENHRIRRVDFESRRISTIAGTGVAGYNGDNLPASSAQLNFPYGLAFTPDGGLLVADDQNHRVRRIDTATGIITTVAGNGSSGFSGDGGAATSATLNRPINLAVDAAGNLFLADLGNNRIRKVDTSGTIQTVAGGGLTLGDGGPATSALLYMPYDVKLDGAGDLWIADRGQHRVRKVDNQGIITTVAGTGTPGSTGDGGPAQLAELNHPIAIGIDSMDNVLISQHSGHNVRRIDVNSGTISTYAGTGSFNYSGDGGNPLLATFRYPGSLFIDHLDDVYIVDVGNHAVRKILNNPPPPTDSYYLWVTPAGQGQLDLSWVDVSATEIGYTIQRSDSANGPFVQVGFTAANATAFSDLSGLQPGTTYYYRIAWLDSGGVTSAFSFVVPGTTWPTTPSAPANLSANAQSSTGIELFWNPVTGPVSGYILQRALGSGSFSLVQTLGATDTSYTDTGLVPATHYTYRVQAFNLGGTGSFGNLATATTWDPVPDAPTNLQAQAVTNAQINLTWTDVATNETFYEVHRSLQPSGPYSLVISLPANSIAFSDFSGLSPNTAYHYRVLAGNGTGGGEADSASATTLSTSVVYAPPISIPCEAGGFCFDIGAGLPLTGVTGIDFSLSFDTSKVNFTGILLDALNLNPAHWDYGAFVNADQSVNVSIYVNGTAPAGTEFTGLGDLFCLQFDKDLSFDQGEDTLALGSLIISYPSGVEAHALEQLALSVTKDSLSPGKLLSWNNLQPLSYDSAQPGAYLPTEVRGVNQNCDSASSDFSLPNLSGDFFHNINHGEHLTIERDIDSSTVVMPFINGMDALRALQISLSDTSFIPAVHQLIAADVNGDGVVTGGDVSAINQRTAMQTLEFPNGTPDWQFADSVVAVQPAFQISSTYPLDDQVGYSRLRVPALDACWPVDVTYTNSCPAFTPSTYLGVLTGDVDGNFNQLAAGGNFKNDQLPIISFDLNGAIAREDCWVDIPVYVQRGDSIMSVDFWVEPDPQSLSFEAVVDTGSQVVALANLFKGNLLFTSYRTRFFDPIAPIAYLRFSTTSASLSEVDFGTAVAYANGDSALAVVTGEFNCEQTLLPEEAINVFPNPNHGEFVVQLIEAEQADLSLFDGTGQLVFRRNVQQVRHGQRVEVPMSGLSAGVYALVIHLDGKTVVKQVIVQ